MKLTDFILPLPTTLLRHGDNVLAIHGLNFGLNSSDFLVQPFLYGGFIPAEVSEIVPGASEYTGPITITKTTHLVARAYHAKPATTPWPYTGAGSGLVPVGSRWSAPLAVSLLVGTTPASAANLRISEIMYHPAPLTTQDRAAGLQDSQDFE